MLRTYTGGKEDYFKREKVHAIATFIQKVYLSGLNSISFSDGDEICQYHIGLLHFLKNEYPDVTVFDPKLSHVSDSCGRFCCYVRAATWFDPEIYKNPTSIGESSEYYGTDTKWLIKRTPSYGFAAKAGHNDEPHNHNDVGAFIIARNERQVITDPGPGRYSQQYFSKDTRYQMLECASLGHSVPYFNDGEIIQKFGKEFGSVDAKFEKGIFSFDFAKAYGDERITSIKRSFSFTEDTITLTDKFVCNGIDSITERIISREKPEINDGEIAFSDTTVSFDNTLCVPSISTGVTTKNSTLYLIDFKLNKGVDKFTLIFK